MKNLTIKEKRQVKDLMASHGLSEKIALTLHLAGVNKFEKIDEAIFAVIDGSVLGVSELEESNEVALTLFDNLSETVEPQVLKSELTKESVEVALGGLLDLALKSKTTPKGLKTIIGLLKASNALTSVGVVTESSVVCYLNDRKYTLEESSNGISLGYTELNSVYSPKTLTENCNIESYSDVIKALEESNYMKEESKSNFMDEDYGHLAKNLIESLNVSEDLAVTLGKAIAVGLTEAYALFEYKHPYILDKTFIKGVNLEDPGLTIGLTEEAGCIVMSKYDNSLPDQLSEGFKTFDPIDPVFDTIEENRKIVDNFKDLLI